MDSTEKDKNLGILCSAAQAGVEAFLDANSDTEGCCTANLQQYLH